ncbi:LOW QUALITY PROTEIN: hemopexin, partial [Numenius arquata]|uniref:LOW QUALITY PROTEIN: hemopexin n=1 Tax=Numenius arquata TaxID=31919 RepID=UPI003D30A3A1
HGNASWGEDGDRCSPRPFGALLSDDAGRIHAFRGNLSFRLDGGGDGQHPWPLPHVWPGLRGGVDAAFAWEGRSYLIQGSQVWVFLSGRGHRLVSGYPRPLQEELGVPRADAAFTCPGSPLLYLITGDRVQRVDLRQSPRGGQEEGPLPHGGVDGAMCTPEGVFLFRGGSFHLYPGVRELLGARHPAPPQSIAPRFLQCPQ